MAATKSGNVWYITAGTTGIISSDQNQRIAHFIVTPTGATPTATIRDPVTQVTILKHVASGSSDTVHRVFEIVPIYLPNGIEIVASTNCDIMLVMHPGGQH